MKITLQVNFLKKMSLLIFRAKFKTGKDFLSSKIESCFDSA